MAMSVWNKRPIPGGNLLSAPLPLTPMSQPTFAPKSVRPLWNCATQVSDRVLFGRHTQKMTATQLMRRLRIHCVSARANGGFSAPEDR